MRLAHCAAYREPDIEASSVPMQSISTFFSTAIAT